jgi:hypothetical protein
MSSFHSEEMCFWMKVMQYGVTMKVLDSGIANEFISQRGNVFLDEGNAILACLQI